jgi:hypothetical protein
LTTTTALNPTDALFDWKPVGRFFEGVSLLHAKNPLTVADARRALDVLDVAVRRAEAQATVDELEGLGK